MGVISAVDRMGFVGLQCQRRISILSNVLLDNIYRRIDEVSKLLELLNWILLGCHYAEMISTTNGGILRLEESFSLQLPQKDDSVGLSRNLLLNIVVP